MLAYCDMKTLYLRNVPDEVVERLQRLAALYGTSVGAVAVRELADVSCAARSPLARWQPRQPAGFWAAGNGWG